MCYWINVEDRLPERNQLVIVAGGVAMLSSMGQWVSFVGNIRPIEWQVTHWMPLPEPPEGE